jgi:hypothetical protein
MQLVNVGRHVIIFGLLVFISESPALAYLGPGLGLGAIGVAIGFIGAIFFGILSLLWYPAKRFLKWRREAKSDLEQDE